MPQKESFYSVFDLRSITVKTATFRKDVEISDESNNIFFEVIAKHSYNFEKNLLRVEIGVVIEDSHLKEEYARFEIWNLFKAENLNRFKINDEEVQLPGEYQVTLNEIASSNVRGIVYQTLRKTKLKKLILPLFEFHPKEEPSKLT